MQGSFACPECGKILEVGGRAPGRQIRCDFCGRLLEIAFLPRSAPTRSKRSRFTRSPWFTWACVGLGATLIIMMLQLGMRFLGGRRDSQKAHSMTRLLESSKRLEAEGRLGLALVDLDAAIDLAAQAGLARKPAIETARIHRADLARRDVSAVMVELDGRSRAPFPLGDWLGLQTRAAGDRDLAAMVAPIQAAFRASVIRFVDAQLDAADREARGGLARSALDRCDSLPSLLEQLAESDRDPRRERARALVAQLVGSRGVVVQTPKGEFVLGSQASYEKEMLPLVATALEAKGYLTYRPHSAFRDLWRQSAYQFRLVVKESLEGNYLSSQNRLTRIEVDLDLELEPAGTRVWRTMPSARTQVPLPNLPAFISSRAAASPERSEDFEHRLYSDARGRIDERVSFALNNIPPCGPQPGGTGR